MVYYLAFTPFLSEAHHIDTLGSTKLAESENPTALLVLQLANSDSLYPSPTLPVNGHAAARRGAAAPTVQK